VGFFWFSFDKSEQFWFVCCMQEYSHGAFQVSGYKVTITNPQEAQGIIQEAWAKFMKGGLSGQVEHKAFQGVHAVYYNYHDLDNPAMLGYDMLLCFITETGSVQSNPNFITITIPAQSYKYTQVTGDFQSILPEVWAKINDMSKSEVNRNYGYDLEMYSEDGKTCTLAVSVKS
jgi:predicted transcriptional regulator YdeE